MNNVIFDFDSTIVKEESFNELLKIALKDDEEKIKQIDDFVNKSMNGLVSVKESIDFRFKIATPNKRELQQVIDKIEIVDGMQELIKDLLGKFNIYIISGGFKEMIEPFAKILNIPLKNIYANEYIYDDDKIIGVKESILLEQQGKAKMLKSLNLNGKKIVIGDGWTDLETYLFGASDEFIAFFGVSKRERVEQKAKLKANNTEELRKIIFSLL